MKYKESYCSHSRPLKLRLLPFHTMVKFYMQVFQKFISRQALIRKHSYLDHRYPGGLTCHKLWTEICEIRQIFKGDLIKFSEILTKISLQLPQNSQKPLLARLYEVQGELL